MEAASSLNARFIPIGGLRNRKTNGEDGEEEEEEDEGERVEEGERVRENVLSRVGLEILMAEDISLFK